MQTDCEAPSVNRLELTSWENLALTSKYRIGELAQLCQVSVRTLQRHFRKHYNLTLSEWLREARLEQARTLLMSADCVKTVAFDLGYKQPSHFTRDFKSRFGVPPSLWQLTAGTQRRIFQGFDHPRAFSQPVVVNC